MPIVQLPSVSVFSHQQTPLHIASRKGYVKAVERLVRLKADISIKDSNGVSRCNHTTEISFIHNYGQMHPAQKVTLHRSRPAFLQENLDCLLYVHKLH